ncbi:MAG: VPLPA-CTERM sorting domain-containing protein [Albimonas sp.]|uniref:VPLPA-CTERM sorting domain-containing protein n=1 Tax=Albimonas sp. TaxID=1872425 RepID=UPI0040566945
MPGKLIASALALSLSAGSAGALTLGGVNFADDAFADAASLSSGTAVNPDFSGLIGASNQSFADIGAGNGSPTIRVDFTDNLVVNAAGVDLYIYAPGEVFAFGVSLTPGFDTGTAATFNLVASPDTVLFADTAPINPYGFNSNSILFAVDLDALGAAPGAEVASIYLSRGDTEGAIYGVGAANSRSLASAVPLPATAWLLGAAVAGLAAARRHG